MRSNSLFTIPAIHHCIQALRKDKFTDRSFEQEWTTEEKAEKKTTKYTSPTKEEILTAATELVYEWQERSQPIIGLKRNTSSSSSKNGNPQDSNSSNSSQKNHSQQHSATVIFLHGLGDTGEGWAENFGNITSKYLPHVKFLFPTATEIPVTMNFNMKMPAWYNIHGLGPRMHEEAPGLTYSCLFMQSLMVLENEILMQQKGEEEGGTASENNDIAKEEGKSQTARSPRLVLAGFSQGGVVALHSTHTFYNMFPQPLYTSSQNEEKKNKKLRDDDDDEKSSFSSPMIAGNIALSSYITSQQSLLQHWQHDHDEIPLFWGHGSSDDMIPGAIARNSFDALTHYKSRRRMNKNNNDDGKKMGGETSEAEEESGKKYATELLVPHQEFKLYRDVGHTCCLDEWVDLTNFLVKLLPPI